MRAARLLRDNNVSNVLRGSKENYDDDELIAAICQSELDAQIRGLDEDPDVCKAVELSILQEQEARARIGGAPHATASAPVHAPRKPSSPRNMQTLQHIDNLPRHNQLLAKPAASTRLDARPAPQGPSSMQKVGSSASRQPLISSGAARQISKAVDGIAGGAFKSAPNGVKARELKDWHSSRQDRVAAIAPLQRGSSGPDLLRKNELWESLAGEVMAERTRGIGSSPAHVEIMKRARSMGESTGDDEQLQRAMELSSLAAGGISAEDAALKKAIALSKVTTAGPMMTKARHGSAGVSVTGPNGAKVRREVGDGEDIMQKALAESKAQESRRREVELRAAMAESRRQVEEQEKRRLEQEIARAREISRVQAEGQAKRMLEEDTRRVQEESRREFETKERIKREKEAAIARKEAEEARAIRKKQEEEYQKSLEADQESERLLREQENQRLLVQREEQQAVVTAKLAAEAAVQNRDMLIEQTLREAQATVPNEPASDLTEGVCKLVLQLPSGERLQRRFMLSHSVKGVLSFAIVHACHKAREKDADELWESLLRKGARVRQNFGGVLKEDSTLQDCGVGSMEKLIIEERDV